MYYTQVKSLTDLDKNYIINNFKLPHTNIMVILNGVYQHSLSNTDLNLIIKDNTLTIPQNTKNEIPLHLLFLTTQNYQSTFNIVVEKNSSINLIEEHACSNNKNYTSKITINITIKTNSEINQQKLLLQNNSESNHQIKTIIKQEENSKFKSIVINKGVKKLFDDSQIKLLGAKACYEHRSINLLSNQQNINNKICIEHLKPNCTSNVLAKSIVNEKATNDFVCRVIAYSEATKNETHVTNKNLLLSNDATANSAPELEIYVDDIVCTHGATVGQLDQDALFYLRSRGIAENEATKMLINAFGQEILTKLPTYNRFKTITNLAYE